ncbi:cytochrome P450, partial [Amanita rubescens]
LKHAQEIVQDGYDKYRGSIFKVPMLTKWMVIVTGSQKIEELRRAPDEILSMRRALAETLNLDVTIGYNFDAFDVNVVKTALTRSIGAKFADVLDEISAAFSEYISPKDGRSNGSRVKAYPTVVDVVCRASNRLFVGLPLCREADYLELNKQFTIDLITAGRFVNLFPLFLRRIAGCFCTRVANGLQRGIKHLEALIKERLELHAQHGKDWTDKPNDVLSWLIDANPNQSKVRDVVLRVLLINLAAIHTSSMAFTQVLYDLATHPEYVKCMRKEVEAVIQKEGWSKASFSKLRKLDSFIKESLRLSPHDTVVMLRKTLKDFTFSDGTTIPAGNIVSVPLISLHRDEAYYTDASKFDGFRFEKMGDREGESAKHQFDTLGTNYFLFGQGRHACPGRFFASNEVKTMLAYVLLNYDVKMANGDERPRNLNIGLSNIPNPSAEVIFRKR